MLPGFPREEPPFLADMANIGVKPSEAPADDSGETKAPGPKVSSEKRNLGLSGRSLFNTAHRTPGKLLSRDLLLSHSSALSRSSRIVLARSKARRNSIYHTETNRIKVTHEHVSHGEWPTSRVLAKRSKRTHASEEIQVVPFRPGEEVHYLLTELFGVVLSGPHSPNNTFAVRSVGDDAVHQIPAAMLARGTPPAGGVPAAEMDSKTLSETLHPTACTPQVDVLEEEVTSWESERRFRFTVRRIGNPGIAIKVRWKLKNVSVGAKFWTPEPPSGEFEMRPIPAAEFDKANQQQLKTIEVHFKTEDTNWNEEGLFKFTLESASVSAESVIAGSPSAAVKRGGVVELAAGAAAKVAKEAAGAMAEAAQAAAQSSAVDTEDELADDSTTHDDLRGPRFEARGVLINGDIFPAGVDPNDPDHPPNRMRIALAFQKHLFEVMPHHSIAALVLNVWPAVAFCVDLYLMITFVNDVTTYTDRAHSDTNLQYGLVYLFNWVALTLSERFAMKLKLGGRAIKKLRLAIAMTMVQLSDKAQHNFDMGDIPKTMNADVHHAVSLVWLNAFNVVKLCIQLVVHALVIMLQIQSMWRTWLVMVMSGITATFFAVLFFVLHFTLSLNTKASHHAMDREGNVVTFATMMESCRSLIINYRKGSLMADLFNILSVEYSKAYFKSGMLAKDLERAVRLPSVLAVACLYPMLTADVRDGSLDLGQFLALLRTTSAAGKGAVAIASSLADMSSGVAAVEKIAQILNQPTRRVMLREHHHGPDPDRAKGKKGGPPEASPGASACVRPILPFANRAENTAQQPECEARHAIRESRYLKSRGQADGGDSPGSMMPDAVIFHNVSISEQGGDDLSGDDDDGNTTLNLRLYPGQIVSLSDAMDATQGNSGKQTLFKLLTEEIVPTKGMVYVPPGWRTSLVPPTPKLFDGSLMYNLLFGVQHHDGCVPGGDDSLWELCEDLGLSAHLIRQPWFDVGLDGCHLSQSDGAVVAIARGLLADADMLLISMAIDMLGADRVFRTLVVLKRYVMNRGLATLTGPSGAVVPFALRRPKLIIFSSRHGETLRLADSHLVLTSDWVAQRGVAMRAKDAWMIADARHFDTLFMCVRNTTLALALETWRGKPLNGKKRTTKPVAKKSDEDTAELIMSVQNTTEHGEVETRNAEVLLRGASEAMKPTWAVCGY